MIAADYFFVFVSGVFASLHCVGMCGPIILAYSTESSFIAEQKYQRILNHVSYNAGRLSSYICVGALVGFLGKMITSIKIVGNYFSVIGGVLMIVMGLGMLRIISVPEIPVLSNLQKRVRGFYKYLFKEQTLLSKYCLGLLTVFLPCGILYAMFIKSAATGSILQGMLTMTAFGLGTIPTLFLLGWLSGFISLKARKFAENIAVVIVILLGISLILRGAPFLFPGTDHSCH